MNYIITRTDSEDELMHYGVLGMKWGVRRNAKVLANNRRNKEVRSIKDQYDMGNISKEQKRSGIKAANTKKRDFIKKTNSDLKGYKNENGLREYKNNMAKTTIKEVPNHRLKKGLVTANKILAGINMSNAVPMAIGGVAALTNPATAPFGLATLGSTVAGGATIAGIHALANMGIRKLS